MGAVEGMWDKELLVKEACFQPWRRKSQLSKFAGALDAVLPDLQRERKLTMEVQAELEALKEQQRSESSLNATTVGISRAREIVRDSEARAAAAESTRRSEATSYEKLLAAEKAQKEDIRKQVVGLVEQQRRLLESLAKRDEEVMLASEEINALKRRIDAMQEMQCSSIQTCAQATQTDGCLHPEIPQDNDVSFCNAQVQTRVLSVLHNEAQTESISLQPTSTQCTQTDGFWEAIHSEVTTERERSETISSKTRTIVDEIRVGVEDLKQHERRQEAWLTLARNLLQGARRQGKDEARSGAPRSTIAQHLARRRRTKSCSPAASPTDEEKRFLRIVYYAWKRTRSPEAQSSPVEEVDAVALRAETGKDGSTREQGELWERGADVHWGSEAEGSRSVEEDHHMELAKAPFCVAKPEQAQQSCTAAGNPADDDLDGGNFPNVELVREFIDEVEKKIGESKMEGALFERCCVDLRSLFSDLTEIVAENQSWCHLPLGGSWSEPGTERSARLVELLKNKPTNVRFSCRRECVRQLCDLVGEIQGLLVALNVTSSEQSDVPVSCIEDPMALQASQPQTATPTEKVSGRESEEELDLQVKNITGGLGREDSERPLPEQLEVLDVPEGSDLDSQQLKGPPGFTTGPHVHNLNADPGVESPCVETDQVHWGNGFDGNDGTSIPPMPPALYNSFAGDHAHSGLVTGEDSIPTLGVSSTWSDVPVRPYYHQNSYFPSFQPGGYDVAVEGIHFNGSQFSPELVPTVPIYSQGAPVGANTAHVTYGSVNQLYPVNFNENSRPQAMGYHGNNGYNLGNWEFQQENEVSLAQSSIPDLGPFDVCDHPIQRAHVEHIRVTQGLDHISNEELMRQMTSFTTIPRGVSPEEADMYLRSMPFQPPENQAFFPSGPQESYSCAPDGSACPRSLDATMAAWSTAQLSSQTQQDYIPLFGRTIGSQECYNIKDDICDEATAVHRGISNQGLPENAVFQEDQIESHSPGGVGETALYRSGLTQEEIANDPYGLGFMDSKWSRESSPGIAVTAPDTRAEFAKVLDQDEGSEGDMNPSNIITKNPNTTIEVDNKVAGQETSKTSAESTKRPKSRNRTLVRRKIVGALKGKKAISSPKVKPVVTGRNSKAKSCSVIAPATRSKRDRTDMSKSMKTVAPQFSSTGKSAGRSVQLKSKKAVAKEENGDQELTVPKIRKLVSSVRRPILKDITQKQAETKKDMTLKKVARSTNPEHHSTVKNIADTSSKKNTSSAASPPPFHVPLSTYVRAPPTSQPAGVSENIIKPLPFVVGAKPNPGFSRKAPLLEGLKEYLPPGQVPLITRSPRKSKLSSETTVPTSGPLVKCPGQSVLLESRSKLAEVEGAVFDSVVDSVGALSIKESMREDISPEKEGPLPISQANESPFRNVGCWNTVASPTVIKFDLLRKVNTDRRRE